MDFQTHARGPSAPRQFRQIGAPVFRERSKLPAQVSPGCRRIPQGAAESPSKPPPNLLKRKSSSPNPRVALSASDRIASCRAGSQDGRATDVAAAVFSPRVNGSARSRSRGEPLRFDIPRETGRSVYFEPPTSLVLVERTCSMGERGGRRSSPSVSSFARFIPDRSKETRSSVDDGSRSEFPSASRVGNDPRRFADVADRVPPTPPAAKHRGIVAAAQSSRPETSGTDGEIVVGLVLRREHRGYANRPETSATVY